MKNTKREVKIREEDDAQADVDIWKYVLGFVDMAVVKCAIELGIADAIEKHEGPMTLSELSSSLGCAPSPLYRIMRCLVHQHIFKEKLTSQGTTGYVQTPISRCLMRHGENSMAAFILLQSSPVTLVAWHSLNALVQTNGTSAFEEAHGVDTWGYIAANPAFAKLFNDAMACESRVSVPIIAEGFPEVFDGVGTLVAVGGGNGTTLRLLVKAFPWIQGINFDLPHVVSLAQESDGMKHVGGDMFECVPKANAVFLKYILHNWADNECIKILKKCREAIPKDKGKVIIAEAVVAEEEEDKLKHVRLMLDMVMMAFTNKGKERTLKEWKYVLEEAGFSRFTVKSIHAVQSVIVAFP